jgi:hypothetical protein
MHPPFGTPRPVEHDPRKKDHMRDELGHPVRTAARSSTGPNATIAAAAYELDAASSIVRSGERVTDGGEGRVEIRSERCHGTDDHDRDEGGDQAVLDGGRAKVVLDERQKETALLGGKNDINFMGTPLLGCTPTCFKRDSSARAQHAPDELKAS